MKKIELLSPAGNFERLKIALLYGADAVYFGGRNIVYVPMLKILVYLKSKKLVNMPIV